MIRVLLLSVLLVGCVDDIDPEWQLDHDRIIAVRATPPRIPAGARAEIDALIGRVGAPPAEEDPIGAMVVRPESLASLVSRDATGWVVTAPDEAGLSAARTELGLEPGAPVPLVVGVAFAATSCPSGEIAEGLAATKTVWLGDSGVNPSLDSARIDDAMPPAGTEIVVDALAETRLSVAFAETDEITWLTSAGTMHDFDLPEAYITIEDEDPTEGDLALVVRLDDGGVAWRVWPLRAQ